MPELLTITEASKKLKVSVRTLRQMIRTGEFPAPVRRNSRWVRIPESDVIDYQTRLLKREPVRPAAAASPP
jgi:excisionase family DNA binding protein